MNLREQNKSIMEISELLKCSRKLIYNAIRHIEKFGTTSNVPRAPKKRKTTIEEDTFIFKTSTADPFLSSTEIKHKLRSEHGTTVCSKTVRNRLNEKNLRGCISQKKPLVTAKNLKARLQFARGNMEKSLYFWRNTLWSDESKFCRFGSDGKKYVWRPQNEQHNPKYTTKTVKHGGGNVMVWASFSWHGVGPIVQITTKMDRFVYRDIMQNHMLPFADDNMPLLWRFMHDNDPKHTSGLVKRWLEENKVSVLKWPAQSPDLNPIENLWNDVEAHISKVKPKNLTVLWEEIQKSWYAISKERCRTLVDSLPRRCAAVIKNKGYPTKY